MEIFVEYPRHEMRHYYGKRKLNLKCNHMAYVFVTQTVISIHCLVTFLSKRFHYGLLTFEAYIIQPLILRVTLSFFD